MITVNMLQTHATNPFSKKITLTLIFDCISIHKAAQTRLVLPWDVTIDQFPADAGCKQ